MGNASHVDNYLKTILAFVYYVSIVNRIDRNCGRPTKCIQSLKTDLITYANSVQPDQSVYLFSVIYISAQMRSLNAPLVRLKVVMDGKY